MGSFYDLSGVGGSRLAGATCLDDEDAVEMKMMMSDHSFQR